MTEGVQFTALGRALLGVSVILLGLSVALGAPVLAGQAALMVAVIAGAHRAHHHRIHQLTAFGVELVLPEGPAVIRGQPLRVDLRVRRRSRGPALWVKVRLRVSGGAHDDAFAVLVPPQAQAVFHRSLTFARAGHWWVHGVELHITGPLRLVEAGGYAAAARMLTVKPSPVSSQALRALRHSPGASGEQVGPSPTGRVGDGVELRELREYVPGDAMRAIAWRATARRGRLLVRATEEVRRRRIQVLVNIGPTMRLGTPGAAPLDDAVDLCAAVFWVYRTDRVGLTTFDQRVYGHIRPAIGGAAQQRALRHLYDLSRVIDADLTEISAGALAAKVGRFLETQDRVKLRRAAVHQRRIASTLVDPLGEIYDAGQLFSTITDHLAQARTEGYAALFAKERPASDTYEARLRLFCALRGLSLPYRLTGPADAAETGHRAALTANLGAHSAEELWVISDLRGLAADGLAVKAMAGMVARKKRVVVLPLAPIPDALHRALRRARVQVFVGSDLRRDGL